ncbi:MAG: response regulator [Gammaproteobacteria bacterium]|nr:response regulator [Gammaproteobacteria bacterium]
MSVEYTVLVVDPDNQTQKELDTILRNDFNIEHILTADNQASAEQELANNQAIHCIIVNSRLDDGGGFEFISKAKQDNKLKNTTVLMISEDNSRDTLLQAAASGASDLLRKPLLPRSVSLKLRRVFNVKQFRVLERISVMGVISTDIVFENGLHLIGEVIDISSGGCSVRTRSFNNCGVYDNCFLTLEDAGVNIKVPAQLIRIEKDHESAETNEKKVICGFQVKQLDADQENALNQFLIQLKQNNPG